QVPAVTTLVAA
ncbi:hypothetical protein CFC21_002857, partial [Triticum aestivum]